MQLAHLIALQDDMITALQAVYGAGQGSVIPLAPAAVTLPATPRTAQCRAPIGEAVLRRMLDFIHSAQCPLVIAP
ncbi:hypothetical protein A1507_01050 [Methylomonas koyamae]|uniref:Uncharacterized protein n=1 Tax=Methylomonas koyamae TaxID=702114 RepID=A0A177NAE1_9GAMM|nr:hypothetical protein [Methylomonas koyamae]OAI14821.1 hypothetical protein A1507_01050 [Methylomonas koyamae]